MSIRDDIRVLCAEHDRFMAEQASEPIRRPPVSETDDAGLVYKQHDNSEPAPAAAAAADWSAWDRWLRAHLDIERRGLLDALEKDMRNLIADLRREWRHDVEREIGVLKNENAELHGKIDVLLALLQTKGSVVDLPRGGWKRDGAA